MSDTLSDEVFTYQESNGFCANPGCPNGDSDFVQGWGNNEAQYYTSCREGYSKNCDVNKNTTENAFIEEGYLKIQPIFNNAEPFEDPYCSDGSCSYTWDFTSARIMTSSKKIISPGSEVTVCFKHPDGSGHWPAIWLLPQGFVEGQKTWPNDGENDLVEHMQNHQAFETQSTIHFGSSGNANNLYKIESVPADVDFYDKFHSVTMRWQTDKIEYYLDTQTEPYLSIDKNNETAFNNNSWPFNENFYLIINVASGGNAGGTPDRSRYCHNAECSNLDDKDKGRMLIDFIEIKSID
jgi:beta-glucanase (GH16 family)